MDNFDDLALAIFADKGVDCRLRRYNDTISNTQAIQIAHTIRDHVLGIKEFKPTPVDHGTIVLTTRGE